MERKKAIVYTPHMTTHLSININQGTEAILADQLLRKQRTPEEVLDRAVRLLELFETSVLRIAIDKEGNMEAFNTITPVIPEISYDLADVNLSLILAGSSARLANR